MSKRTKTPKATKLAKARTSGKDKLPLVEHLYELRRRLFIVAVSVVGGSIAAYAVQQHIIAVLLRPSHGQHFIYTSPLGGINFLFSVCMDIGIAISVPLIIYQLLRFVQPLMRTTTVKFIFTISIISGVVGLGGVLFGYFIGLPAALNFLLHQFASAQIKPLVTIQSYMSFVSMYLLGSALMFQLPLILIIINRIKPLKPGRLLHYERHVIIFAFITAFIMNPTPNVLDQMMVVIPIILMYQVGIALIWFINRHGSYTKFQQLIDQDIVMRAQRLEQAASLQPLLAVTKQAVEALQPHHQAELELIPAPVMDETPPPTTALPQPRSERPYVDSFVRGPRTNYQRYTPRLIQ